MLRTKPKPQSQKAAQHKNQTERKSLEKYPKIGSKGPMQNPVS